MIINKYYYHFKPLIPRSFQLFLRRHYVRIRKKKYRDIWPIDERTATPPSGWPGWPDRKKFALVLTHDVEKQGGVEKCLQLMEIEKQHGFRSSFNFVPHDYTDPRELRKQLTDSGFEVGVHGLTHDGNMFRDRALFERQSVLINKYLKDWGSVGFRAPSMYHNLEWILELDIEYDLSTFDTDPFEPQSDGVGAIFPFRVSGNGSRPGYVELPYTIPQDFLLFIILRHKSIDVWTRKLDWIADHGGMVLLNVHPDYINFGGSKSSIEEYPIKYYIELLNYINTKYKGQYWQALPHEVGKFYREVVKDDGSSWNRNLVAYD